MRLTKHHGLGNDFLVLLADDAPLIGLDGLPDLARRGCNRRRGVGADGLILGARPDQAGVDVTMVLHNADGSRAEMSGNGIRCLAQAWAARHAGHRHVRVATDAGMRVVEVWDAGEPDTVLASVAMGSARPIEEPAGWAALGCDPARPVAHLSLGNPHSVVAVDDVDDVDLGHLGALVPQVNLEIVAPGPERHGIRMRVHERGAGITEACGTGACAAAHAAAHWGLATPLGGEILVHMDGGDAIVRLGAGPDGDVVLVGPAAYVATVVLPGPDERSTEPMDLA